MHWGENPAATVKPRSSRVKDSVSTITEQSRHATTRTQKKTLARSTILHRRGSKAIKPVLTGLIPIIFVTMGRRASAAPSTSGAIYPEVPGYQITPHQHPNLHHHHSPLRFLFWGRITSRTLLPVTQRCWPQQWPRNGCATASLSFDTRCSVRKPCHLEQIVFELGPLPSRRCWITSAAITSILVIGANPYLVTGVPTTTASAYWDWKARGMSLHGFCTRWKTGSQLSVCGLFVDRSPRG